MRARWTSSPPPVLRALALFFALIGLACFGLCTSSLRRILVQGEQVAEVVNVASAAAASASDAVPPASLRAGLVRVVEVARAGLEPIGVLAASKGRDLLVLLSSTAIGLPLIRSLGVASKVLGFLAIGIVIGPSGFALISDIHWSETLAEAGIIFFLCEMGLELSFDRLKNMRRNVFGLGTAQFAFTTGVIYAFARAFLGFNEVQACILGTALSLSSSVFVLQILDESKERGTIQGRSAFGILLFQDLVVPFLLVLLPMLNAGSSAAILAAVKNAGVNALLALSPILFGGRFLLNKAFGFVAASGNTVAMRALSFFTVLGMCYMFQVFSLSNTLGAFLAGVILSETAYRESVEIAISPIREDLLGLFFITVGFGIDLRLVLTKPVLVLSAMSGLLLCKALVTCIVCIISGMSFANSQHVGLLLCQAGEFAFVMLGIAQEIGAFSAQQAQLLLTVTSVSMACTPLLSRLGRDLSRSLQEKKKKSGAGDGDSTSEEREKLDGARVIICGYGRSGTLVSQLLDTKFIPWVAFDVDNEIVDQARAKGLPVFFGEALECITRARRGKGPIGMDSRKVAVITPSNPGATLQAARGLRQFFPELPIVARAMSTASARELRQLRAEPIVPGHNQDTILMNLSIGAFVLKALGCSDSDAETVVNTIRRELLASEGQAKAKSGALLNLVKWYQGERAQELKSQTADVLKLGLLDKGPATSAA